MTKRKCRERRLSGVQPEKLKRWCHGVVEPNTFLSWGSLSSQGSGFKIDLKWDGWGRVCSWCHRIKSLRTVSRNRWNLTTSYHPCWIIERAIAHCLIERKVAVTEVLWWKEAKSQSALLSSTPLESHYWSMCYVWSVLLRFRCVNLISAQTSLFLL